MTNSNKLSVNELSTNERRDLVARAIDDSPAELDATVYKLVAAENHESDFTHDPEELRSQVYSALISKIATQAGVEVETEDPVTNSILRESSESTDSTDETDDGSDWASPIASSRSAELDAAQDRAADDEGWPSGSARRRSEELDQGGD